MRATARIGVEAGPAGGSRLVDLRSDPPVAVRHAGDRVLVVASAAAPVGGDELALELRVGAGARLAAGSAAATVVWPGRTGARSVTDVHAVVGEGGHLEWRPEPVVSVAGSDHLARTTIELATGATCVVLDEVALGRSSESSGTVELDLTVRRGGETLLRHTERLGPAEPGWGGAALVGAARHLVTVVVVGPPAGEPGSSIDPVAGSAAWLPLGVDAALALAVGPDRAAAWHALDAVAGPRIR